MSEETYVYTACPGWGDHEYCALKTIVRDGKIIRTEKADYTGAEADEAYICQKGLASFRQVTNPDRLTTPLKRIGKRGEGKWEEISWDQALDEIAEKMLELKEKYGPESIAMWSLAASYPPTFGLAAILGTRFAGLWGMTDPMHAYGLDNGPLFSGFYNFQNPMMYMIVDPRVFDYSDVIIVWGANPIENQQRISNHIIEAKSRGAKIIDIGLVFDGTAGKADWFIPVKPGSDPFLALAMAKIIVESKRYDKQFLIEHTVSAYLVREDDGQFMRDGDGNYLVWDETSDSLSAVAPEGGQIYADSPALNGEYDAWGVKVKPAFQKLREHLAQYTLEEASRTTGMPIDDITKLTEIYASAEKAYIVGALGLRYQNCGESYRSFYLLAALTGNLGKLGGGATSALMPTSGPAPLNDYPITRPLGAEGNKTQWIKQDDYFKQVMGGKSNHKGMFIISGNPVHNCPDRTRWIKTFDNMELVVDFDIWLTDTGELADYVLPDCMPFERYDIIASACYNHIVLQEPAIEPGEGIKDANHLFSGLAERVGLGEYFDKTTEEWLAIRLQVEDYPPISTIDPPLTYERLKKEKMVRLNTPEWPPFDPLNGLQFSTATGRMEIYAERLADLGHGFASYFPPLESPVIDNNNEEYPYQFFSGRQRFFMQSMYTDDPLMVELSGGEPSARINPIDAEKEGILDGDKVEVYNQRGHVIAKMRLDEAIPPQTIQVWFGWRQRQFEEGTYAELLTPLGDSYTLNELSDRWWDDWADVAPPETSYSGGATTATGAWDTIWDCACAIRKVEEGKGA